MEDGYDEQQIFNIEETASVGKRCHLGSSQLERRVSDWLQSFKGQADSLVRG
jgi:hypothetical protein